MHGEAAGEGLQRFAANVERELDARGLLRTGIDDADFVLNLIDHD